MTVEDLSPVMRQAYESLSTVEQKEDFLEQYNAMRQQMTRSAIAQVISRNLSHGIGKHVIAKGN